MIEILDHLFCVNIESVLHFFSRQIHRPLIKWLTTNLSNIEFILHENKKKKHYLSSSQCEKFILLEHLFQCNINSYCLDWKHLRSNR